MDEIIALFEEKIRHRAEIHAQDVVGPIGGVDVSIRASMIQYAALVNGGVK